MYAITWQTNLISRLGEMDVFILLISCICHDLDHPGYNNVYQINAKTELALRWVNRTAEPRLNIPSRVLNIDSIQVQWHLAAGESSLFHRLPPLGVSWLQLARKYQQRHVQVIHLLWMCSRRDSQTVITVQFVIYSSTGRYVRVLSDAY